MSVEIDLNADLGEGAPYDEALMSVITSCNIACRGHTGDETTMRTALTLAKRHGVAAGAHPSFPDRETFGRSRSDLSGAALEDTLNTQVMALKRLADEFDMSLTHLKPHGALYNMAASDEGLSNSIIKVLKSVLPGANFVGPPGSALQKTAAANGVEFVAEGFADRAYEADGSLRDRALSGALILDPDVQAEQASQMTFDQSVTAFTGETFHLPVRSICVHGDTPGAYEAAKLIRERLIKSGAEICPPR
ncbi:MAG: 5-oxoprolinase subunit PxpA [Pseudomonadota bacterium]